MHKNGRNLVGKRFGRLVVISDSGLRNNHREIIWSCICDCGSTVNKTSGTLLWNKSFSCGCTRKGPKLKFRKKKVDDAPQRRSFGAYRRAAEIRNYDFELSLEQFKKLCSSDCYYCSSPPSMRKKTKYDLVLMNGVDRLDNSIGYIDGNCVPCCSLCNMMKSDLSFSEFISHIEKVYHFGRVKSAANRDGNRAS